MRQEHAAAFQCPSESALPIEINRRMRQHQRALLRSHPIRMIPAYLQDPIRFASCLFGYVFLATLVGPAHAETPTRLDAIMEGGILRVGLTEDYRPFLVR